VLVTRDVRALSWRLIDAHRDRFGVEPICRALQFAPRTYWAAKARPLCARARRDEALKPEIARVHAENFGVYGADKVWAQLNREGIRVARCTVERLMRQLGVRARCAGSPSAPRRPMSPRPGRVTSSIGTSPRQRRTGCGSRT
jgi:putative transposase